MAAHHRRCELQYPSAPYTVFAKTSYFVDAMKRMRLRKPFLLRQIVGKSMLPNFREGRVLIASGWFGRLKPADVVIIRHDGREKVKRVHRVTENKLFVLGDNAAQSTDSRDFGWLPLRVVSAKVIWPRTRSGWPEEL